MRDPIHVRNWRRLDEQITSSGQPTDAELVEIQKLGVTHIINLALHTHEDALADERASVAALGMTYVHIPVEFDAPTESQFEAFCDAMAQVGADLVHVHCIINARVSAFLYRYRRDVLNVDEPVARAAMEAIWRPGGVWARFIGDAASESLSHRPPLKT
jgi:uncharacterized protein (TIGR01244 family)